MDFEKLYHTLAQMNVDYLLKQREKKLERITKHEK